MLARTSRQSQSNRALSRHNVLRYSANTHYSTYTTSLCAYRNLYYKFARECTTSLKNHVLPDYVSAYDQKDLNLLYKNLQMVCGCTTIMFPDARNELESTYNLFFMKRKS